MKQTSKFQVGLDFRMAANTGIGTYLNGLVEGFRINKNPKPENLALFSQKPASQVGFSKVFFDAPIYSIQEQWQYPQFVRMCELWHAPHYNIPYCKGRAKLVVTVHDIIHWVYRKQFNFLQRTYAEKMLRRTIHLADHILTVSKHSKADLINYFDAPPDKITVVYNGVSPDFFPRAKGQLELEWKAIQQKYLLPESFFLYVGMLKPHKNVLKLLRIFIKLKQENKIQSSLVVIGQGAANSTETQLLKDHADIITHLPRIQSGELPVFYNRARALVHPSLYEGFGLTVLESLACGTPVLTTSRASLPEVGGKAARYIDGEDESEMTNALQEWDADSTLKLRLHDVCLEQACKFSWDKAARETSQVYEKVLTA